MEGPGVTIYSCEGFSKALPSLCFPSVCLGDVALQDLTLNPSSQPLLQLIPQYSSQFGDYANPFTAMGLRAVEEA